MRPPLFLFHETEVMCASRSEDLEVEIESPDIHEYEVYDADGRRLEISVPAKSRMDGLPAWMVAIDRVELTDGELSDATRNQFESKLRDFVEKFDSSYSQMSLEQLISVAARHLRGT